MNIKSILAITLLLTACAPALQSSPPLEPAPAPLTAPKPFIGLIYNFENMARIKTSYDLRAAAIQVAQSLNYDVRPKDLRITACKIQSTGFYSPISFVNDHGKAVNATKMMIVKAKIETPANPRITVCVAFLATSDNWKSAFTISSETLKAVNAREYATLEDALTATVQNTMLEANALENAQR